jgi:hypothetical protein
VNETNAQRLRRIYMRWEALPIVALCVLTLGLASVRFGMMAREPDSHWTRQNNENEWLQKLEKQRKKDQDE